MVNIIQNYIEKHDFITLDIYMQLCLQDDIHGYYRTGNPLGKQGDFITAPEISQIFGELIGIFIIFHCDKLFPKDYQICELGAGRGTLAVDYLKTLKQKPPRDIFFLESNDILKRNQLDNIPQAKHISSLNELPDYPTFFLANEFFDALPIKAFKVFGSEQSEIIIKLDNTNKLYFDYATPIKNSTKNYCGYYETSPITIDYCKKITHFIRKNTGAFLCCDYGYVVSPEMLTFRGFQNHNVTDGLQSPCHEDLTADVNCFYQNNLNIYHLISQAEFLKALHIETRLHRLLRNVKENDIKQNLIIGVQKLINASEMGDKFKFLFVTNQSGEFYPFIKPYQP